MGYMYFSIVTTPTLFARARGEPYTPGDHCCFYCGGACDSQHAARRYVADSFTERGSVACPGSPYVCGGCVACLRSDLGSVPLIDGTTHASKAGGKRKPRDGSAGTIQVRWFSWVVTGSTAVAATPAHREFLARVCLDPPETPYAICLADGNKHQLYKTPVNHSRERIAVNCEGVRVDYSPDELRERIDLCLRLIAVVGKGSKSLARLADQTCDMGVVLQLANHYSDADALYAEWRRVRNQPLSDLAIFISPGKEDALERLDTGAAAS